MSNVFHTKDLPLFMNTFLYLNIQLNKRPLSNTTIPGLSFASAEEINHEKIILIITNATTNRTLKEIRI
jgi:hypothetical protein